MEKAIGNGGLFDKRIRPVNLQVLNTYSVAL